MDINLTSIFSEINEQFAVAEGKSNGNETINSQLFLTHIQLVRVRHGKREILDTIKIEKGIDILEKMKDRALALSKFGAVMVVKIYETIECEFEHNPAYEVPVLKYKQAQEWQRRGLGRR